MIHIYAGDTVHTVQRYWKLAGLQAGLFGSCRSSARANILLSVECVQSERVLWTLLRLTAPDFWGAIVIVKYHCMHGD